MAKLLLEELSEHSCLSVVIESYDGALYQAFVAQEGAERLIWADHHTPLKTRNLTNMRTLLSTLNLESLHLRQNSAYDEMIGQSQRQQPNTLLLPISLEPPNLTDITASQQGHWPDND
ncbi:hypothetical protein G8770_15270 [Aestuariicella hydrocarbonica]|uniref:Uncharacterized protein n=1 Tax=Pseudomaricurvus hydrocarbonicus TaxID=1470433 RepID=A0A9E5JXR7_9GAMM|nr:DUF6482 family protein [Aestuariicella hydrocarbonica]NHO66910.1 hypothetical protein [Aestuariicella hydrocarbonica]